MAVRCGLAIADPCGTEKPLTKPPAILIELGFKMPGSQQGTPRLADPAMARKIIDRY